MTNRGKPKTFHSRIAKPNKTTDDSQKLALDDKQVGQSIRKLEQTINALYQHHAAGSEREESRYPLKRRLDLWTFRVISVYTIITALLFGVGLYQAKVSYEAMVSDGRAWVVADKLEIGPQVPIVDFHVHSINIGKSPATDVEFSEISVNVVPLTSNYFVIESAVWPDTTSCAHESNTGNGYLLLPAPDPGIWEDGTFNITQTIAPEILGVPTGNDGIMITGCITYKTFDEIHHTQYCFLIKKGLSNDYPTTICTNGVYAD